MSHDHLKNFYEVNFSLMHHHKYSLTELESMLPWERQMYIDMLAKHIREENEKARDLAAIKNRNVR